tara:strand:+ start:1201 stop:1494 length:294 start_codon:yes stop_codon:yes gene_type:complete
MAQQVFKITNATQVKMLEIDGGVSNIKSMTIANIHSGDATVDLFLANSTDNYYIFKNLVLPAGQTLKLEGNEVSFDNKIFNLFIKLAGSTPVDVIIN